LSDRRLQTTKPVVGIAANSVDHGARPLLDIAVLREGPGQADEVTRRHVLTSYRSGLSDSLKGIARTLPGCLAGDERLTLEFHEALHSLRSASLTVGMNRVPWIARDVRTAPTERLVERTAQLLQAVRETLPFLEAALETLPDASVTAGERR
ncbi:MAG: hypothetical protein WBA35_05865, partial [Litorimonas sp.]